MLIVATLLWDANAASEPFSRIYDETWVEKLYWGFRRNLTGDFKMVCYSDRPRQYDANIQTLRIRNPSPSYADCIQPYELNMPMILVGLDTIITGNCDRLASYCTSAPPGWDIALPRDPNRPHQACNGVALVPAGHGRVYDDHRGENDMEWMRAQPHVFIDDICPGYVRSYKNHIRSPRGVAGDLGDARIVYFHGDGKPHQVRRIEPWIDRHWRIGF